MNKRIWISPAYGRTYKSAMQARKDWDAGLDFEHFAPSLVSGRYINKGDHLKYIPEYEVVMEIENFHYTISNAHSKE